MYVICWKEKGKQLWEYAHREDDMVMFIDDLCGRLNITPDCLFVFHTDKQAYTLNTET
jgi:hypothetical protein